MDGQTLYGMYETATRQFGTPWDRLTEPERESWNHLASRIRDWYDEE